MFLQKVQQRHLVMLSGLAAADAMSLVWVDLKLVWLSCSDQLGHQEICVEEVNVLVQEAVEDKQAVRLIGQLLHMQGYRPCLIALLVIFGDIHVSFRVPCVIGHPHSDRSARNGYLCPSEAGVPGLASHIELLADAILGSVVAGNEEGDSASWGGLNTCGLWMSPMSERKPP